MLGRVKRGLYRTTEILDYRTFVVATAFLITALVGYLVFSAFQAAHDSTSAANQRGQAATRRIDLLNREIDELNDQLRGLTADAARERGELSTKIDALAEQVRRMGGRPIVVTTASPSPSAARSSPTPAPRPTNRPTARPRPSATPSPTCTALPIVGCLP